MMLMFQMNGVPLTAMLVFFDPGERGFLIKKQRRFDLIPIAALLLGDPIKMPPDWEGCRR